MEQPLRRNQFDMNSPIEGDAGAMPNRGDVSRQAGHILLHDSPHGGEISLGMAEQAPDPAAQVARTELPAWYNVKFNAIDQVVEQEYGQAFHQEQRAERAGNDDAVATTPTTNGGVQPQAMVGQNPLQTQAPTIPAAPSVPAYAAPVVPVPQIATPLADSNPIYGVMAHPLPANQPQPIDGPTTVQVPTPVSVVPTPQGSIEQPHLSGAINPSFIQPPATPMLPVSPQFAEPKLPEGTPLHADAQHLLPVSTKRFSSYIRSPWIWLAVGILMILYFAKSL